MAYDAHFNLGYATIGVAPSPATSGTTLSLTNALAARFPDPASVGEYNAVVWPANQLPLPSNAEIIRITAKGAADSGGTGYTEYTISRVAEQDAASSMTARSIQVGDQIISGPTKKWFTDIETNKVEGAASSTDNAIARFDGTTGKAVQNSSVTVSDTGDILTAGKASVGVATTPTSIFRVYEDTSTGDSGDGLTIEQDGTGDALLHLLLTAGQRWLVGIDNSDGDKFKIAPDSSLGSADALVINTSGQVGIGTSSPDSDLEVVGDYKVSDADTATKAYRFRTSGSGLDVDFAGQDIVISGYPNGDFTGTQKQYLTMGSTFDFVNARGNWEWKDRTGGAVQHQINGEGGVVFNEQGADRDTRIEGDTDTHLVFVDASTDRVGIGANTVGAKLHVSQANGAGDVAVKIQNNATTTNETTSVSFTNTTTVADSSALLTSTRNSASDHSFSILTRLGNVLAERLGIGTTATVINETGIDHDFRVEGDTDANLVVVDASTDQVGIGTATTTEKLTVNGGGRFNGDYNETSTNPGAYAGRAGSGTNTPRFGLFNGTAAQNWQIDNNAGTFRWFLPGVVHMQLTSTVLTANQGFVANETGGDFDTRIEGDTDANLIFVDASTDRVGIGTNTPENKLHVQSTGTVLMKVRSTSAVGTARSFIQLLRGSATSAEDGWDLSSNLSQANDEFSIREINTGGTTNSRLTILKGGNVGVGTTSPSTKLDVNGTGNFAGDVTVPDEAYGSAWNASLEVPTKNAIYDELETIRGNGLTVKGYEQPDLPYTADGWAIKSIDFQIVTKFDTWDFLSDSQINLMLDEAKTAGATHIAVAMPYDRTTKWTRWVDLIRAKKFAINFRSAWDMWQGINQIRSGITLTRSGSTVTATCGQPHYLATGSQVTISGANEADYNGTFTVTVTNSTVFTYTIAGTPTTPATGYIESTPVTTITRSGSTATVIMAIDHGLTTGQKVNISGASQAEYNGEFTVTVTNSKTFTMTVSGTPATPATGTIKVYYSWETYRDKTAAFIEDNSSYFQPGDMFAMCVEPNNAVSTGVTNYTFYDTRISSGSIDMARFNDSLKEQVYYANQAFDSIGLHRQVHTWAIAPSVDLANLNGVSWYSTSGNANGLGYLDYLKYFGGYVCFDHYQDASILDAATYAERMAYDLEAFTRSFPGCKYFQGEIGYHTEQVVSDQNQQDVLWAVSQELLKAKHVCGVNYWVNLGSTTTSLWDDTSGTVTAGGRLAVRGAITQAFKYGTNAVEVYGEGVLGGNRTKLDFTGSDNVYVAATDNPSSNKVDIAIVPALSKTTVHNYVSNPSFESSLTGWTNYGTYDTIERSTAQANNGSASIRINNATAKDGGVVSDAITLSAGTYYISAYRKLSSSVDNANLIVRTVGGSTHGSGITSGYPGNTNWNRVGFSFTLGSTTTIEILLGLGSYGSASDGEAFFDGIQLELGSSASTYFDGSTADAGNTYYSWAGAEHASSSVAITVTPITETTIRDALGVGTLTVDDLAVDDEAYGAGWNGSLEVPTKNAVYDKIETITAGTQSFARSFALMGS